MLKQYQMVDSHPIAGQMGAGLPGGGMPGSSLPVSVSMAGSMSPIEIKMEVS